VGLVGDVDRERAVVSLREHFAAGRLTLEELDERVERALEARSQRALRRSLVDLPESPGRSLVRAVARSAVLLLLTWTWFAFSFALLVVSSLTLLLHGATLELGAILVVWLVPTYLLWRAWRRTLPGWLSSPRHVQ
jgi:Flp pilus assembly protein TadB